MADFPSLRAELSESEVLGVDLSDTNLTSVTSGVNSYGAYVQMVASTLEDAKGFWVTVHKEASLIEESAVTVGIGSTGNEQGILIDGNTQVVINEAPYRFFVPVPIPAGTRIAVKMVSNRSASVYRCGITLVKGSLISLPSLSSARAYGKSSLTTGTAIDPGATGDTKSAYVQLEASILEDIKGFYVCFGTDDNRFHSNARFLIDIAIGSTGNEKNIVKNLYTFAGAQEPTREPIFHDYRIPAGSRIAAAAQCNITESEDRIIAISLLGFN